MHKESRTVRPGDGRRFGLPPKNPSVQNIPVRDFRYQGHYNGLIVDSAPTNGLVNPWQRFIKVVFFSAKNGTEHKHK